MATYLQKLGRFLDPTYKKRKAEAEIAQMKGDIRSSIEATPTYEMPPEVQQMLDLYQSQAGKIEGLAGLGMEATGIAKAEAGAAELPGMAAAREQIASTTAGTVQDIIEAGGAGAGALGAIAQAGQNELNAMRDLSIQNQQFKQQASDEYRQALMSQAGLESGLLGQSAALQGAGLGTAIGQRGLMYQSEMDKARALQQFDITELGNVMAQEEARRARNARIFGSLISGIGTVAGAVAGNPQIGGMIGGLAGGAVESAAGNQDMGSANVSQLGKQIGMMGMGAAF